MGTAMRFFVVLAGLGFMVFAFAMIGPSLYDVFSDFFADFWGNAAVLLMLAVVAAAPFYVGVRLVRKGLRGEPPPSSAISAAAPLVIDVPGSMVVEAPSITSSAATDAARSRLGRRGDRDLGGSFLSELRLRTSELRQPAVLFGLLRTSYGLAIATYLVAALLMLIWHAQSAEIGITGLAIYSLFDPVLNLTRPSWWTGAIVSFGVGMALFFMLLLTAAILRYPLGDDQYNFFYPLLLYIPVMGLLGLVRFFDNLRRSD